MDAYSPPADGKARSSRIVTGIWHTEQRHMDDVEIYAKATIAAALIASRAVEVPSIPLRGQWGHDAASLRLRDLTDYLYQIITTSKVDPN
jgi:hypothetical protein